MSSCVLFELTHDDRSDFSQSTILFLCEVTEKCVIPGGSHFREGNDAAKLGFPPAIYFPRSSYEFFADTCVEIWDYVMTHGIRTYDIDMKNAQLKKLKIPCSVLLVDESQDLDQCQVAWAESQKEFGEWLHIMCMLYLDLVTPRRQRS